MEGLLALFFFENFIRKRTNDFTKNSYFLKKKQDLGINFCYCDIGYDNQLCVRAILVVNLDLQKLIVKAISHRSKLRKNALKPIAVKWLEEKIKKINL